MDEAFDIAPEPTPPAATPAAPEPAPAAEPQKQEATPPAPAAEPKKDDLETPVIDEDFFGEEPEKKEDVVEPAKADGFDEEAFDKETEEATKGMDAKAGDKFKSLRAELKQAKQQIVSPDIQKKLSELEIKAQEADGLRTRLAEVSSQSAKLMMENEPDYQEQVVEPAANIFSRAKELADLYETNPEILKAIIKERDRKVQNELIAEHLKEFSDFDRNEIYLMTKDFNGLIAKREKMLAKAEEHIELAKAKRIEQETKLLQEQRLAVQTIQKDIWNKYKDVIPGFVDDDGETPEFKKLMGKALSIDFSTARARDQAFAAFAGVTLPHAVAQIAELKKRLSAYEKGDAKSRKTAPSPSGSITQTPAEQPKSSSFMEDFQNMNFA